VEVSMPRVSSNPPVNHERPSSFISLLSGWAQQGVESFFATQRILVDLVLRENTNAMKSIREGLSASEAKDSPVKILTEIAVEGTANYVEAQRILLDLAQQENEIVLNGVKDRVGRYESAVAMTNVIRRSIDTFVEMQQNFLVLANKRTQGWLQSSPKAGDLAGIASEAMEEFVAAQKKFLDVVAEETSGEAKKDNAGKRTSKPELLQLGRNAADSFIEAQKRLLDLAGQQMNVNMQAASRAMELKMPLRFPPVADIAGESVKSFMDAEKALLNTMVKTRKVDKEPAKAKRSVKRPASRTKAKAAHAGASEA